MRTVVLTTALLGAIASAQPVTYTRAGNLIQFRAREGSAEFEWVGGASFRFQRDWTQHSGPKLPRAGELIACEITEQGTALVLKSRFLTVTVDRATFGIVVDPGEGKPRIDLGVIERHPGKLVVNRALAAKERIWGIGPAPQAKGLDTRGSQIARDRAFLISSSGYGQYFRTIGNYVFDVGASRPDRMRVLLQGTDRLEQFFYYGPTPKEILEAHRDQVGADELPSDYLRVLRTRELPGDATRVDAPANACDLTRVLGQLAMSAELYPALDIEDTPPQITALLPLIYTTSGRFDKRVSDLRKRWTPYMIAYLREAYDRGLPLMRPLAMQFPKDPSLADVSDLIMAGDELLIVPPCDASGRRLATLPMGIWTDLRSEREYEGRRPIYFEANENAWPVLVKNGSILPVDAGDWMELHYYPKSGAEFFLLERQVEEHSQFHAGPAGDFWRLETESKVRRRYEWAVHHVDRPRQVMRNDSPLRQAPTRIEMEPGEWYHDAIARILYVLVDAGPTDDHIVNIRF